MDWQPAILAGLGHFCFVFFKALQQRNVMGLHYAWIAPVSLCMSTTEIVVLSSIAVSAVEAEHFTDMLPYVVTLGTGGAVGSIIAMYLHHRFITRKI